MANGLREGCIAEFLAVAHMRNHLAHITMREKSLKKRREVLRLHDHVSSIVEVVDPLAKFLADGVEHG